MSDAVQEGAAAAETAAETAVVTDGATALASDAGADEGSDEDRSDVVGADEVGSAVVGGPEGGEAPASAADAAADAADAAADASPAAAVPPPPSKEKASAAAGEDASADGNDVQPFKKVKKNLSAYMFFTIANRERVREELPGTSMGEQAKALGARWAELSEEDKKPYEANAAEDKERYQREVAEQLAAGHVQPTASKKNAEELLPHETVIPISRVKRTCKLDPEVKNITKEATAVVAKATEHFLALMAEQSYKISALSGRRTVKTEDIRDCVARLPQFEWLRDDFPLDMDVTSGSTGTSAARSSSDSQQQAVPSRSIETFFQAPAPAAPEKALVPVSAEEQQPVF